MSTYNWTLENVITIIKKYMHCDVISNIEVNNSISVKFYGHEDDWNRVKWYNENDENCIKDETEILVLNSKHILITWYKFNSEYLVDLYIDCYEKKQKNIIYNNIDILIEDLIDVWIDITQ